MAVHKLQVFLASRFDEFKELREGLRNRVNALKVPPVEAIDLNDNAPDSRPPLSRCYEAVDQAELFVLLVGDTYGTGPKGHQESYTHLEYRHALNDGTKAVLPFLIGYSHNKSFEAHHYSNRSLGNWIKEIREHHTPSYLDPSVEHDELANDVFNAILARLVELFADVGESDFDDFGEETVKSLDDSPIKRDQLAQSPKFLSDRPRSEQPLRILAANHASEALLALNLNLPKLAIHHLRNAVDLVPLDIVTGYWLSRLLIATGRTKQCHDGRRIALQCAQVAGRYEDELTFQTMACRVLAARASERLGEMDLALEYAEGAHEGMPYHWMAKLEYGRQLALTGNKIAALEKAKEGFWLQPKTIIQIQNDAAYRGLRRDFHDFLASLRQTVREETDAITRVESKIDEFEKEVGVANLEPEATGIDALLSLFSVVAKPSFEMSSATELLAPPKEAREVERSESRSTLRLIAEGRVSARSSLEMLQRCAKQLSKEAVAFEFHGNKGYTSEIKELLTATIADVNGNIRTLSDQRRQAGVEARRANQKSDQLVEIGMWVGGGMVVVLLLLALAGYLWMPELFLAVAGLVALGCLGAWLGYGEFKKLEQLNSAAVAKSNRVERELTTEKSVLAELTNQLRAFEQGELRLRRQISSFCDLTNRFESVALRRVTLSPVPPMDRRGNQVLVRIDPAKASDLQVELDDQLLPLDLRYLVEDSSARSKYWVGRRGKVGEIDVLSRSAAYFQ